jgi:hypothetical protein
MRTRAGTSDNATHILREKPLVMGFKASACSHFVMTAHPNLGCVLRRLRVEAAAVALSQLL